MATGTVLAEVIELLERWGWSQHADQSDTGFDIIGAFEEVTGMSLRAAIPEADIVISTFVDPECDRSLRCLARLIGADPADGPLPDERWAWIHVITQFNDRVEASWPMVRRHLHEAREEVLRRA